MKSLCIAVDRLAYPFAEHLRAKQNLKSAVRYLQNVQYGLYGSNYQFAMRAAGITNEAQRLANTVDALNFYVVQSAKIYRALEQNLIKKADLINGKKPLSSSEIDDLSHRIGDGLQMWKEQLGSLKPSKSADTETTKQDDWSLDFFKGYFESTASGLHNSSIISLLYEGIKYQIEGAYHIANVGINKQFNDNCTISAEAGVGNIEASGSVKGVLFDNKGFNPTLKAEGEAAVSAFQAKAKSVLKNDFIKNTFKTQVDVGVASASGKAVISKNEVTLAGEVGVAAARVSGEETFELWGLKITLRGSAELGFGGSSGYSQTSNSFEVGASCSLLFGFGAGLKIEW